MQFDFAPFHDWEINMLAIKKARKLIEAKPTDEASVTLADLVADADAAALMRSAAGQPTIQPLIAFPRVR